MGERVWGSSSLETGSSHHKIWNNPSFSIKIVISASFSILRLFSFFGAICWRSFDQSKVSIYQCPKKQKPQFTLTNIINLIKFKWKLETGKIVQRSRSRTKQTTDTNTDSDSDGDSYSYSYSDLKKSGN